MENFTNPFSSKKPKTKQEAVKDGKKPVSQKQDVNLSEWAPDGNQLLVPKPILEKGDRDGYEFRWLSVLEMEKNSGIHKRGWRIYHFDNPEDLGVYDWKHGKQDSGTLRRGNMILGYKPKAAAEYHRKWNVNKTRAQARFPEDKAEELRQITKEGNMDARILTGYDD